MRVLLICAVSLALLVVSPAAASRAGGVPRAEGCAWQANATALTLRAALRTEDLLARYGGEEFVVLARGVDLKQGTHLAERLRAVTQRQPVSAGGKTIARTLSAGVATLACCGEDPSVARVLGLADERLYQAKEGGRNRVVGG